MFRTWHDGVKFLRHLLRDAVDEEGHGEGVVLHLPRREVEQDLDVLARREDARPALDETMKSVIMSVTQVYVCTHDPGAMLMHAAARHKGSYMRASCGPHFDRYDVFLLQLSGSKTWQLDAGAHQEHQLQQVQA